MSKKIHIAVGAKGVGKTFTTKQFAKEDGIGFGQPFINNQLHFVHSSKFRADNKVFSQMVSFNKFINQWDVYAEASQLLFIKLNNKRRLLFDDDGTVGFI